MIDIPALVIMRQPQLVKKKGLLDKLTVNNDDIIKTKQGAKTYTDILRNLP